VQDLIASTNEFDASGNPKLSDIGTHLKKILKQYFDRADVKYIDPTYMIRAIATTSPDRVYCKVLAHNAVHAAFAGFTGAPTVAQSSLRAPEQVERGPACICAILRLAEVLNHAQPSLVRGALCVTLCFAASVGMWHGLCWQASSLFWSVPLVPAICVHASTLCFVASRNTHYSGACHLDAPCLSDSHSHQSACRYHSGAGEHALRVPAYSRGDCAATHCGPERQGLEQATCNHRPAQLQATVVQRGLS
jgi:hypothetical protein